MILTSSAPTFSGFCRIHLQAQDYGWSLTHSLLHCVLLSLLVRVQPAASLTWTCFCERFGLTFLLQRAFRAGFFYIDIISNYNFLVLSHSTSIVRLWGQSSTFSSSSSSSSTSLSPFSAGTDLPRHSGLFNPKSNHCCFHGYSLKVSPPPWYSFPSRSLGTFPRQNVASSIIKIYWRYPLKMGHRSEFLRPRCSFQSRRLHPTNSLS